MGYRLSVVGWQLSVGGFFVEKNFKYRVYHFYLYAVYVNLADKFLFMKNSYRDLEVYKDSFSQHLEIHRLSMQLPKFELYELGSQVRRSSDSIVSNIVEGYGRRRYKNEFIRFLIFSHASCLETACHMERISLLYPNICKSIVNLIVKNDNLGKKLFKFILYVEKNWTTDN